MSKQVKLLLFVLILFAIGLVVASVFWQGDTIYSGAYAPIVKRAQQRKLQADQENGHSEQPDAPGFKEKDIDRQKGDGYATY